MPSVRMRSLACASRVRRSRRATAVSNAVLVSSSIGAWPPLFASSSSSRVILV